VDVIFFLNFFFDLLLLLTVKIILKRKISLFRAILGAVVGALSTFLLFFSISSFTLFLFKVVVSIFMILSTFGKIGFLKNIGYLYFVSILLGGFLTFINNQFAYKQKGLVFFFDGVSVPLIVLLVLSPIIFYFYYKQTRYFEKKLSNIHTVSLILNGKTYSYRAFLDTGNTLIEPYKGRAVHLLFDPKLSKQFDKFLPVEYQTINSSGFVRGVVFDKMIVDEHYEMDAPFIGFLSQKFYLDDASMILNNQISSSLD